jgi:hypothetical protein
MIFLNLEPARKSFVSPIQLHLADRSFILFKNIPTNWNSPFTSQTCKVLAEVFNQMKTQTISILSKFSFQSAFRLAMKRKESLRMGLIIGRTRIMKNCSVRTLTRKFILRIDRICWFSQTTKRRGFEWMCQLFGLLILWMNRSCR